MWHLHWRAEMARAESMRFETAAAGSGRTTTATASSFQRVWHDTPAATVAADVPESVRVRGR